MIKTLIFTLAALIVVLMSNVYVGRAEDSDTLWTKDLFGSGFVINALFSPDDKTIFVSTTENFFELDALTGNIIREIPGIKGMERFIDNYQYFISYDMKKYTFPEMQLVNDYEYIYKLASLISYDFNKDGSIVIYINSIMNSVENSYPMHIFDAKTNELLFKFKSQESFHQIKISPDGKTFVTTSSDLVDIPNPNDDITYLRVWDVSTFKEIKKIEIGEIGLGSQKFSPDGNYYSINGGSYIYLYDTKTWELVDTFTIDGFALNSFTFSKDSKSIFLTESGYETHLYQIIQKHLLKTYPPKKGSQDIIISNNNQFLISLSGYDVYLLKNSLSSVDGNSDSINIYPNPVKNILSLQNINGIIENATLCSVIGTVLNSTLDYIKSDNTLQFDFSNLKAGTYLLTLYSDNQVFTVKFIKE